MAIAASRAARRKLSVRAAEFIYPQLSISWHRTGQRIFPPVSDSLTPGPSAIDTPKNFTSVAVPVKAWPQPQKNVERNRVVTIDSIQGRGLGIKSDICAKAHLPQASLPQVANSAERVSSDAKRWVRLISREKLVLIDEFQPRVGVIAPQKVQGRFRQIAVLDAAVDFFVLPSPNQGCGPVPAAERAIIRNRSRLSFFVSRLERLRVHQSSIAVLRCPIARGRGAHAKGPG